METEVLLFEFLNTTNGRAVILPVALVRRVLELSLKVVVLHLRHLQLVLEKLELSSHVHTLVVGHSVNGTVRACRIISVTTDLTLVAGRVYTGGREVLAAGLPVAADVGR